MTTKRLFFVFVIVAAVSFASFIPQSFGCSRAFNLDPFLPYTTFLHGDCTEDIGHLSWSGLIMIEIGAVAGIIIIKKFLKLPSKFYLAVIPTVLAGVLLYSVAFYGTADITEFFLPHDYLGNLDHLNYAQQISSKDFEGMLAKRDVKYRAENLFVTFNHDQYTREQYRNHEFVMPYDHCGIVIADDRTNYWYSSVYDDKKILESQIHEENPQTCEEGEKTCFCQVTRLISDRFKFRP